MGAVLTLLYRKFPTIFDSSKNHQPMAPFPSLSTFDDNDILSINSTYDDASILSE